MTKLERELIELGCPYAWTDERAKVWLAGFHACIRHDLKRMAQEGAIAAA